MYCTTLYHHILSQSCLQLIWRANRGKDSPCLEVNYGFYLLSGYAYYILYISGEFYCFSHIYLKKFANMYESQQLRQISGLSVCFLFRTFLPNLWGRGKKAKLLDYVPWSQTVKLNGKPTRPLGKPLNFHGICQFVGKVGRLIMNDPTQVVMILFATICYFFQIVFNYILVCCSRYGSYFFCSDVSNI